MENGFFSLLLFSLVSYGAEDFKPWYQCHLHALDQELLETLSDIELKVYDPKSTADQAKSAVTLYVRSAPARVRLDVGGVTLESSETLRVTGNSVIGAIGGSPDGEVGYLVKIKADGSKSAKLFAFSSDIKKNEIEKRAEFLGDLRCDR